MSAGSRPIPLLLRATVAWLAFGCAALAQQAPLGDLQLRADPGALTSTLPGLPASARDGEPDKSASPKPHAKAKLAEKRLPPLQPYRGAQRLGLRGGAPDPNANSADLTPIGAVAPAPTVAATPAPPPLRRIPADPAPFDPVGLRLGDIDLKPYFEQDVGYASNPLALGGGGVKSSGFETSEAGLSWQSVWSRDDLHGQLKGGYTDYFATPEANGGYGSGAIDGRYDATRDLSFDAEGRFNVAPEPLSSLGLIAADGHNPYVPIATYGATIGGAQKFGDLTLALHGTYDATSYTDVALAGASVSNLASDDYNDWGLRARASYRLSEAVSPFVELDYDVRRYDGQTDAGGYQRDSQGGAARAGVTMAFSQLLTGEASLGYGEREYQDPRLPRASAPLIDASLIWAATPLTTLTLKAQTQLNDSVLPGASADVNRVYSVELSHALTRQITLGLVGAYGTDNYVGVAQTDASTSFGAKAEYHLDRDIVVKASATRQIYASSLNGGGYSGNVFLLGIRLQR